MRQVFKDCEERFLLGGLCCLPLTSSPRIHRMSHVLINVILDLMFFSMLCIWTVKKTNMRRLIECGLSHEM